MKELLAAEHIRLWLVDETNSQIWEWSRDDGVPIKRSLLPSESPIEEHVCMFPVSFKFIRCENWQKWLATALRPKSNSACPANSEPKLTCNSVSQNLFTRKGRKRALVKPGIAADVARTGISINVPFPAVQSQSFSIEIDRLPGVNARTVMCEPIRHEGSIVAVTQ